MARPEGAYVIRGDEVAWQLAVEVNRTMISIVRDATRNVKRWRDGKMALRWIAAAMLEAERQYRKVDGYRDLHVLKQALERHQEVIEGTKKVA